MGFCRYSSRCSPVTIQVTNNGTASNSVVLFSGKTSPGVFTLGQNGLGDGAVLHADFSVVNSNGPAKAGETVQVYISGAEATGSAVAAGVGGPSSPLATLENPVEVFVGGLPAKVSYQGLAPTLAGLYQLNVIIPAGVAAGNATLEISTVGAFNSQATIAVGK